MKPTFNKYNNNNDGAKTGKKQRHNNSKPQEHQITNPFNNTNRNLAEKQDSQIISGYFLNEKSYKELVIARLNNFLYGVLVVLVLFCVICYYFVSCAEVRLNQISRATLELNYENEELQNKIDSLQSYYNIDKAVAKANILERAKQVVEVDAIDIPNMKFNKRRNIQGKSVVVSY